MEIIILGSGTGIPSLERGSPGLVAKVGKDVILFDSGPGTLNRLLKMDIDYRELDYIFYTHFHPDHITELVPFLFACKYHSNPRTKPLKIIGANGLKNIYFGLFEVYGEWIVPDKYEVEIIELDGSPFEGNGWTVYSKNLKHVESSMGYRVEDEKRNSFVYSGDTEYCKEIVELARNTNLLILECAFPNEHRAKGHLYPKLAGRVAKESNCKYLVLNHMYPVCDKYDMSKECKKEFDGKITVARDFMHFNVV